MSTIKNYEKAYPALAFDTEVKPPRPLRVCVASFDFVGPVKNGGVGTAFTSLAEGLARAGHDVTCLFLAGKWCENRTMEHWIEDYRQKGIKFVPMPESGLRFETAWHIAKAYEAYLWLKEQNFDVVHFSEWKGPGFFSLTAKHQGLAFENTLLCVHTHGPTLWHKLSNGEYVTSVEDVHMDYLECRSVQMAEVLVSPSQYLLQWMIERNWTLPEKTFVQPYLRPATARAPLADADRCHQISELVFFGRLEVRKGLVLFCDALDLLKDDPQLRHATITFLGKADKIGNHPSADYLAARSKNWPWKWQLVSDRDQAGAMDYLQTAGRLAVLPSLVDNLPNTVLECLGAKVPFIASNAGGIPEMIAEADLEATCFPLKARDFAARLRHVLLHGIRPATPAWDPQVNEHAWVKWHEGQVSAQPALLGGIALGLSNTEPLVSVCMSHWNRPHYLKQALASIEAMDYPNFEVVLVDDGSTQPEALKLIEELTPEFARRGWQLLRHAENRFPGASRNLAARHARGEYIMFMDDDNCAKPHELSTFVRVARKTGADILACCLDTFTGTDAPHGKLTPRSRWIFVGDDASTGAIRNCFGDTNSLMRREVFLKLGGFHEDWGVGHEDWEFFAKAVLHGCKLQVIPEALAWYRLNVTEQTVNRKTPVHRNHMANIRPYLAAVPPGLKNLVYLAQGQDILIAGGGGGGARLPDAAETKLSVAWRAKVESARMFVRLKQKAPAIDLLLEAIKVVESAKHPTMLFETLVTVAQEMQGLDKNRAEQIARIGLQLAKALKNDSMQQAASKLIAEITGVKTKAVAAAPAPAKANHAPAVAFKPGEPTSAPLVSVVIPVFNKLELTRGCLASLAKTTVATQFEIIVVDNASTDGTPEFLKQEAEAKRVRVVTNPKNGGFAQACNLGGQAARGSIVIFLNNDTQVTDGWLDPLVQAVQQPQVGVVGAKLLYANGTIQHAGIEFIKGVPDHPHRHAPADAPAANRFRELDMVTGACFMMPRELFLSLAGFDECFRNGVEDVDLCLRVRAAGWKVVYEPKSVVYHLEGQSAGRFDHVRENLTLFFQRWGKSFDANMRFVVKPPVKISPASRSVLLGAAVQAGVKRIVAAWEGSFLDFGSLSHVNRELTRALADSDHVRLQCINSAAAEKNAVTPKALEKLASTLAQKSGADTQVTIRHAWPPNWERPAQGKLVVIQPWEFGTLPESWAVKSRAVDEFWLPSEYVRRVYIESGVPAEKVFVVPNGVDEQAFNPQAAPMKLATDKKFKFLFVGGTIGRKGPDLLLQAYLKNFTAGDDVCLVIKDFGGKSVYTGMTFEKQIRAAQARPGAPEILYLNDELPPESLPGLYTACDCFVMPYRGEGFCLPVLEAMACGLPVVVTAGGATDDFVRDEFAYRIPSVKKVFGQEVSGMKLVGDGWLLEPDLAALGESMRHVFTHPDEARERGRIASRHAHQSWSWKNAAGHAAKRLCVLAGKDAKISHPAPISLSAKPPVAGIGQLTEARELFAAKNFPEAWQAVTLAMGKRPFHPEAWMLLAEIAFVAGAGKVAKVCAQHARAIAPAWNLPKQFLARPLKGDAKPEWLDISRLKPQSASLTVCLIVKNEERFIAQCLQSIRGLASQIVVVDTGSTDRTVEIAREFGAQLQSFAWCDDFAAARNAALEYATGEWVLMLDADEELPAAQHARLLADMKHAEAIGFRLPLANRGQENEGRSFVPRLFRNAPGIFYHGRIHEQLFPNLMPLCKAWGLETALGTAEILHHGYTKEMVRDRNKIERNLKLLHQAIVENPADVNLVMNLGLELVRSDKLAEGIEKYREAFAMMSAQPAADVVPELREALLTQYVCQLYKVRGHDEVVRALNSPLAKHGGLTASMHLSLGLSLFELKHYAEAAEQMRACLAKNRQPALTPINVDIHSAAPSHCLALCLARLDDLAGAEKAFVTAVAATARANEARVDFAKFLAERQRPVEALQQLHTAIQTDPQFLPAWKLGGQIALARNEFWEFALDWTGEAQAQFQDDLILKSQRAEALMLAGRIEAAAAAWRAVCEKDRLPRSLAALILCDGLAGKPFPPPVGGTEEEQTSRAFIGWYQKLLATSSQSAVIKLGERLNELGVALPSAAGMLRAALSEATVPE